MTIQNCWSRSTWVLRVKAAGFQTEQRCVHVCTHGFVCCAEGLVQVKSVKYGKQYESNVATFDSESGWSQAPPPAYNATLDRMSKQQVRLSWRTHSMGRVLYSEVHEHMPGAESCTRVAKDDDPSCRLFLVHCMSGWDIHGVKRNVQNLQRIHIGSMG
jgi:hypothetical protein